MSVSFPDGTGAYLGPNVVGTGALSIQTWFRFDALKAFNVVWAVSVGDLSNYNALYFDGGSGNVVCFAAPATQTDLIVGASAGVWYWCGAALAGTSGVFYTSTGLGPITTTAVTIAGDPGDQLDLAEDLPPLGSTNLGGQLFGTKVWKAALSAGELAQERLSAWQKRGGIYSRPQLFNATGAGVDWSGNGNAFASNNAPVTSTSMPPIPGGLAVPQRV